jgi:hypothetical protein
MLPQGCSLVEAEKASRKEEELELAGFEATNISAG